MLLRTPAYYDSFVCTASRCTDSCCIGWEIDVDAASAARYAALPGPFGDRLRGCLCADPPRLAQDSAGRCALLRPDGLCELICRLGPGQLCSICAEHPRFYNRLPGLREAGLGLCCEEAARLLLSSPLPDRFIARRTDEPELLFSASEDAVFARRLLVVRQATFSVARWQKVRPGVRAGMLCALADTAQSVLAEDSDADQNLLAACRDDSWLAQLAGAVQTQAIEHAAGTAAFWSRVGTFLQKTPPMNPGWPAKLSLLPEVCLAPAIADAAGADAFFEHLLIYYLYRWVPQAAADGQPAKKLLFAALAAALSTLLLRAKPGGTARPIGLSAQIAAAKACSKEIEYAPGLPDRLTDALCRDIPLGDWCAALNV